ncbi:MAG: tripartite tricarboxylate transporter substrate binding protein [Deltaproteobacteria bacterium]|nr:tripartite tricarboxylate transporter substrate binding protein [Deltaproteobacteria bacterium]
MGDSACFLGTYKTLNKGGPVMRLLSYSKMSFVAGFLLVFLAPFPPSASCQTYPDKPINIYCGFAAGATTDLTARGLANGLEKLLGVPVVVENKAGGGATVAAGLVASKKPDGYTLGVVSTGVISVRPHLLKLAYDPLKDFTLICQYARYIGAVTVLKDSPFKNIEEFIAHAKVNPGLSYASPGMYTQQHLATELFRQCKGLDFKHVPTKGGAEANTQLLGKHVNFVAGAGQHIQYVKQGVFRMLAVFNTDKRDPNYPDVPTIKELGCQDAPALGYIVVGPKGLPEAIYKKLSEAIKKVTEGPDFQKLLSHLEIPYDYKDRAQLEKDVLVEYEFYKTFLEKMGAKKE